jgi:hypothetical protein
VPRLLTAQMQNAAVQSVVRPAFLLEAEFKSGFVRFVTAARTLDWSGQTFFNSGILLNISQIEENAVFEASGFSVSLSGVPPDLVQKSHADYVRGKPMRIWLALLDQNFQIIPEPKMIAGGRMDTLSYSASQSDATITITVESRAIDYGRINGVRLTDGDQQRRFPGDLFFEHMARLQKEEINWGSDGAPTSGGSSGGRNAQGG